MERVWLNHYPAGIPPDVDLDEFTSLVDVLRTSCRRFAELPAYNSMGAQMTYAELDRESLAFAAWLQKSLALRRGDRVAIMMPNLLQYPVAMFGALRAGMVVVNVNPQYTVTELEHQLLDSGAAAVVVLENFVCPLPLYHVYALSSSLVFMKIGAKTILVANPRDMHAFLHDLKKHPFTAMIGVNTMYRALLDAPGFAEVDTCSLKMANAGGMAVQRVVAERWKQATGIPLVEAYGLTESSPGAIANPLDIDDWTGMIGMPIPSTQAVILDDSDNVLAPNEVGEICLRGPQVMAGYWKRPDETALAFTREGWLRTGDMGFMDERGWFKITDRKKDMIVVSGFKVFPNQIEDVVAMHPGVAEVAAIGVADARSGEAVKIVVVRSDATLTAQVLLDHCRQHLTGYKMPRFVAFTDVPLPKSNLGKILRRQVREASVSAAKAGEPVP